MTVPVELNVPKILLIVEDQILLAMVLKDELEDGGYRVLKLAIRHQEALGFAREVKPDLALVSAAQRTRETWDIAGQGMSPAPVLALATTGSGTGMAAMSPAVYGWAARR